MPEKHIGTKFNTNFLPGAVHYPQSGKLLDWCRRFETLGLSPDYGNGSCGNLSLRVDEGFIITPTTAYFHDIAEDDLVLVVDCDFGKRCVTARGKREPSSESLLHYAVYAQRPEVNAVFHGHDEAVVAHARELGQVETPNAQPYGSVELAAEVIASLGHNDYLVMKEHGFLSLGTDMEAAGNLALAISARARRISAPR